MYSFLNISSSPDKVLLGFIKKLVDFVGKEDGLYDMVGNTSKISFCKSDSPNHVEEFSFPTSKSGMHAVKEELEVSKFWGCLK